MRIIDCLRFFKLSYNSRLLRFILGLFICLSPSVQAAGVSGIMSVSNNYFYRGYSKTYDEPTGRVNIDYEHSSGFYAGTWVSRINYDDGDYKGHSNIEFYPYLGFSYKVLDNWRLEAIVARYIFDGHLFGKQSDYNEYSALLHFSDLITARIAYADDAYHRGKTVLDYEISARYPILKNLQISSGVGYNNQNPYLAGDNLKAVNGHTLYWNVGVTWFIKNFSLDVRYADAAHDYTILHTDDGNKIPYLYDNFIFTLSASF